MSWKAFVLGHLPDAECRRNDRVRPEYRYGIYAGGLLYYLGPTPALAWKSGAERILRSKLP
jgi:hypothetical protein